MAQSKDQPQQIKLGEFNLIADYFAPLAKAPGALGLLDDGAIVSINPGEELITTTDMLISGVHFLETAGPEQIATRLLAVNVSDLAAMGATPLGYLLVTALTPAQDGDWLSRFAKRLDRDQTRYGMTLLGGDTVATPGPLCLTVTAFGTVPAGSALKRSMARVGDQIYVSGTLGDSALGLKALQGDLPDLDQHHRDFLVDRLENPQPQYELGPSLRGIAGGIADISDGFVADLSHICAASGVGAEVLADQVPLSAAARAVIDCTPSSFTTILTTILTGGDDYELVFTALPESQGQIAHIAALLGLNLTPVGTITAGSGVTVIDANQNVIPLKTIGYKHF
ncbi:MAG: thiamine-phosphate kinase [Rhodospirillales bacterium]